MKSVVMATIAMSNIGLGTLLRFWSVVHPNRYLGVPKPIFDIEKRYLTGESGISVKNIHFNSKIKYEFIFFLNIFTV